MTIVAWNQKHSKLTTADESGLIVVWVLYKGIWYEEMINNRNKSAVCGMHWNKDGSKIGILYEDGMQDECIRVSLTFEGTIIVGSVEGSRLWTKDFKSVMAHIQWSPDGNLILAATASGELNVYDSSGFLIVG